MLKIHHVMVTKTHGTTSEPLTGSDAFHVPQEFRRASRARAEIVDLRSR